MKKIIFHPHALEALKKRNLKKAEIKEALREPINVTNGKFGRKIAQKLYRGYVLRIIYEEFEESVLVITAYIAKAERYSK